MVAHTFAFIISIHYKITVVVHYKILLEDLILFFLSPLRSASALFFYGDAAASYSAYSILLASNIIFFIHFSI